MLCSVLYVCIIIRCIHTSLNQNYLRAHLHAVLADWCVLHPPAHLTALRLGCIPGQSISQICCLIIYVLACFTPCMVQARVHSWAEQQPS
jgi:hypothetical protein